VDPAEQPTVGWQQRHSEPEGLARRKGLRLIPAVRLNSGRHLSQPVSNESGASRDAPADRVARLHKCCWDLSAEADCSKETWASSLCSSYSSASVTIWKSSIQPRRA
jgi:hypothetical protein